MSESVLLSLLKIKSIMFGEFWLHDRFLFVHLYVTPQYRHAVWCLIGQHFACLWLSFTSLYYCNFLVYCFLGRRPKHACTSSFNMMIRLICCIKAAGFVYQSVRNSELSRESLHCNEWDKYHCYQHILRFFVGLRDEAYWNFPSLCFSPTKSISHLSSTKWQFLQWKLSFGSRMIVR